MKIRRIRKKRHCLVNITNLLASTIILDTKGSQRAFTDKSSPHLILTGLQGVDAVCNGNAGVSERTGC